MKDEEAIGGGNEVSLRSTPPRGFSILNIQRADCRRRRGAAPMFEKGLITGGAGRGAAAAVKLGRL